MHAWDAHIWGKPSWVSKLCLGRKCHLTKLGSKLRLSRGIQDEEEEGAEEEEREVEGRWRKEETGRGGGCKIRKRDRKKGRRFKGIWEFLIRRKQFTLCLRGWNSPTCNRPKFHNHLSFQLSFFSLLSLFFFFAFFPSSLLSFFPSLHSFFILFFSFSF